MSDLRADQPSSITPENMIEELIKAIPEYAPEHPDLAPVALGQLVVALSDRAGGGVDDGHAVAGEVDEEPLPGG
ncbi:MAG: hypothetical protein ACREQ5_10080, partial [Candidatus Dormibacteria bacterium]